MGLARGLVSALQSAAATVANLVGQTVTALKFTSTQASGSDGFAATTNGARWHFGAGASDYASSDGTTVAFAGPVSAAGVTSSGVTPFNISGATGRITWTTSGRYMSVVEATGTLTLNALGLDVPAAFVLSSYTDDSATAGNRTVNKVRGKNAIAIGAATCVVTNNFVTANSQILVTLEFADATATTILNCIPAAGSFTLTVNANATAATKFSWTVIN